MTNKQNYSGFYYWMGMALDIQEMGGQLVAAVPGVPAGYEVVLEPLGKDSFMNWGGPIDGGTMTFVRNHEGDVIALRAGSFDFAKVPRKAVNNLPVTEHLLAPELNLTPEKESVFASLLQTLLVKSSGGWVDYNLPYPKHEFVQYITSQNEIIFHGSSNPEIETFAPFRKSVELHDESGRGNLQAVYGTHDGLWAMFFAVVDRVKLRGSIRNGVMYFRNRNGRSLAVYNFSINQEQLVEKPWREGALYFLPRVTFVRLKLTEHAYANEWASEAPVQPIAKLRVQPEDFPFLDRVGGHDDGEILRLQGLGEEIREAAIRATLQGDRFTVTVPAEMRIQLAEYVELQRTMMPAARLVVTPSGDGVVLEITTLPPAFRQVLGEKYADLIAK